MRKLCWVLLLPVLSIWPAPASAAPTSPVPEASSQDIDDGPLVMRIRQSGSVVIYTHDDLTKKDTTVQPSQAGRAALVAENDDFAGGVRRVDGIDLRFDPTVSKSCFLSSHGACAAEILGPLFPPQAPAVKRRFDAYVTWIATRTPGLVKAAQEPVCQQYARQRSLALLLGTGAQAFPSVYDPKARETLAFALDTLANELTSRPATAYLHSSYATICRLTKSPDDPEYLTLYMVVDGLSAWRRMAASAGSIDPYVRAAWRAAKTAGYEKYEEFLIGAGNASLANGLGQYLSFATNAQRAGIGALPLESTTLALQKLFDSQILTAGSTCGRYSLTYGSWVHSLARPSSRACTQNLGYHRLVVIGLLEAWIRLRPAACATAPVRGVCGRMPGALAAALAWLVDLQDPASGAIFDRAPGSSDDAPRITSNGTGVDVAYRIVAALRAAGWNASSRVRISGDGRSLALHEIEQRLFDALNADVPDNSGLGGYLAYRIQMLASAGSREQPRTQ